MDINTWVFLMAMIEVYIQHINDPELVKKAAKFKMDLRDGNLVLVEGSAYKAQTQAVKDTTTPVVERAIHTILECEQLVGRKLTAGERIDLLMTNIEEAADFRDAMLLLTKLDREHGPKLLNW